MRFILDLVYLLAFVILSPWLVYRAITTGKYRRGLLDKFLGRVPPLGAPSRRRALFHGVSVGEVHLLRQVIAAFRQRHPDWQCVVSTTTDTGYAEAKKHFADLPVFFFPFDFSWAVRRALRTVAPALVVLAEGEIWPNFLLAAKHFGAKVVVVNGRLSPRSARRHRRLRWLTGPLWRRLDLIAMQTQEYADAIAALGVPRERLCVTGSVKYDGVHGDRQDGRVQQMRRLLGVGPGDRVWVWGSTQAPEEEIALETYRRLQGVIDGLRLVLVPRQKDRFDEVAGLLRRSGLPFVRRSELTGPVANRGAVVLVDTIGELSAVWGLAEVAFVGGSLDGKRGGQNMIEPAAYGAAVIFGPHVWNFRDAATRLVAAGGAVQVADAAELEAALRELLGDGERRGRMGAAARQFVLAQQGATARTMAAIDALLRAGPARGAA
jgi:3-deoxy-D-manno-octulosonic-acid transferase